jgi:hypothetical protein
MAIKKFQVQTPLVSPIGIVQPSMAGARAGQQLQQTGYNLAEQGYKLAVAEQQEVGREYAVQLQTRNEDGRVEYKAIPDAMSPVARRTAKSLVDSKYQTSIKLDLLSKAKTARVREDGSPATADQYDADMKGWVDKTAELNPRYESFIKEIAAPTIAEHLTDIRVKAYDAAMKADFKNKASELDEAISHMSSLASSDAGSQPITVDDSDLEGLITTTPVDVMRQRIEESVEEFIDLHGNRLELGKQTELRNAVKLAYHGGKIKNMASQIAADYMNSLNPYADYNQEQDLLRSMLSVLESPETIQDLPADTRQRLEQIGFTQNFAANPDMAAVQSKLKTELRTYANDREKIFNTNKTRFQNAVSLNHFQAGGVLSTARSEQVLSEQGITSGADIINKLGTELNFFDNQTTLLEQLAMSNSPLPKPLRDVFEDDALYDMAIASGKAGQLLGLYENMTFQNGVFTSRGLDDQTIVKMEALRTYSGSLQSMDLNTFATKRAEFMRMSSDDRGDAVKRIMGSDTMDTFMNKTGAKSGEEIAFFQDLIPVLLYTHGSAKTKDILNQSKNKIFAKSKHIYSPTGDADATSRYSPEARYGAYYPTFELHVDAALNAIDPSLTLKSGRVKLIPDPRGGTQMPYYYVVKTDGSPVMRNNRPLVVGGMSVSRAMELSYQKSQNEHIKDLIAANQKYKDYEQRKADKPSPQKIIRSAQDQMLDDIMKRSQ